MKMLRIFIVKEFGLRFALRRLRGKIE